MKKKNILITGADGFIGSHLTELMVREGFNVTALSMYNSFNDWGWLEEVECKNDIEIISGDIRDPDFCKKITKGKDIVFHLAALIGIPYSYLAPQSYVDTNIKGTMNICQAALDNEIEQMIHTSTSEVYGTANYVPIDEKHPTQAQSPYSASKISADAMAMSFYNSFELPLVIARPFNTYGPRQSSRAIIPTIITQIANGLSKIDLGDLTPTRDFNFVSDTCNGFLLLSGCEKANGEIVNIGSNTEISIGDLVNKIKTLMGSDIEIQTDPKRIRPKNSEVFRLVCDNQKINELVSYKPSIAIDEGLKKTIDWLLIPENLNKYKADIFNV
ncbi:MAG: NAD-dependent dehydratase [Gammaproteobacteria bacterium]|nr:NAD-dependent dehydratase [Gammaproteobacteria bacterium]|tara:strand:- start:18716 stop:19702 length:987 start_codon:yes stop_codon:yes gene_type:complete